MFISKFCLLWNAVHQAPELIGEKLADVFTPHSRRRAKALQIDVTSDEDKNSEECKPIRRQSSRLSAKVAVEAIACLDEPVVRLISHFIYLFDIYNESGTHTMFSVCTICISSWFDVSHMHEDVTLDLLN